MEPQNINFFSSEGKQCGFGGLRPRNPPCIQAIEKLLQNAPPGFFREGVNMATFIGDPGNSQGGSFDRSL